MQNWLDEYAVSHQNPINKTIHWICIPLIYFTVMGFLWSVPLPFFHLGPVEGNLAIIVIGLVFAYYAMLSITLSLGMLLYSTLCGYVCFRIDQSETLPALWIISLIVFVLAWIGQFYGHSVEGKKPSFLKDIQFLMIGPAWLMSFIFKKIGIKY